MMKCTTTVALEAVYEDAKGLDGMNLDQLFRLKARVIKQAGKANAMQIGALGKLLAEVRARIRVVDIK